MRRIACVGLAVLAVAGCGEIVTAHPFTHGPNITEDQLKQLVQDKATVDAVTAKFGDPMTSDSSPKLRTLGYVYATGTCGPSGQKLIDKAISDLVDPKKDDPKAYCPHGEAAVPSSIKRTVVLMAFTPSGMMVSYKIEHK